MKAFHLIKEEEFFLIAIFHLFVIKKKIPLHPFHSTVNIAPDTAMKIIAIAAHL
jgi:hypothetical protein